MKNFMIILFSLFVVSKLEAQVLQFFTAQEGMQSAIEAAKDDGMIDPEIIFIGCTNKDINLPIVGVVSIEFKLEDGSSNVWLYLLQSKSNSQNRLAYAVGKVAFIGFQDQPLPIEDINNTGIDFDSEGTLSGFNWVDSDEISESFLDDNELADFYLLHPEPNSLILALYLNKGISEFPKGDPVWTITIGDGGLLKTCNAHAVNKSLVCEPLSVTTIQENSISNVFIVYPNPTNDNITIKREFNSEPISIEVYNTMGEIVLRDVTNRETINIDYLPNGSYLVLIRLANQLISKRFDKIR